MPTTRNTGPISNMAHGSSCPTALKGDSAGTTNHTAPSTGNRTPKVSRMGMSVRLTKSEARIAWRDRPLRRAADEADAAGILIGEIPPTSIAAARSAMTSSSSSLVTVNASCRGASAGVCGETVAACGAEGASGLTSDGTSADGSSADVSSAGASIGADKTSITGGGCETTPSEGGGSGTDSIVETNGDSGRAESNGDSTTGISDAKAGSMAATGESGCADGEGGVGGVGGVGGAVGRLVRSA